MQKVGWFFVFAFGITFCRLPAAAQSISYSQTLDLGGAGGFGGFRQGDVIGSDLQSFSLPQFSPAMGNLNSVELTFSTSTTVDFDFYTTAIGDPPFGYLGPGGSDSFQADYFLTEYDAASNTILELDLSQSLSGGDTQFSWFYDGQHTFFHYTATASGYDATSQQILPSDPNFATYLGSGNLNFSTEFVYDISQSGYTDDPFGFLISLTNSDSQSLVTVTYDYSPLAVPEPSSLALLAGLCLVGASHLSQRRRRARQSP